MKKPDLLSAHKLAALVALHLAAALCALASGHTQMACLFLVVLSMVAFLVGARTERYRSDAAVVLARCECRDLLLSQARSCWRAGLTERSDTITEVLVEFDKRWPEAKP